MSTDTGAAGTEGRGAGQLQAATSVARAGRSLGRSPSLLVLEEVAAFYGPAQALAGVSLTVQPGEVVGVVGQNGAGKSTLLRTISGLHRKVTGRIRYGETSLVGLRPDLTAKAGVSFVRDGAHVFENLTVREHLLLAERIGSIRRSERLPMERILELFPILERRGVHTKAGYLSGGQRQALCLAMAVGGGASCLLLDEPSAGLAESTATEIFAIIRRFCDQGVSLLIAEQDIRWLDGLADRIAELEMGRIVRYLQS